jgi:hypothetical protein
MAGRPIEKQLLREAPAALARLLDVPEQALKVHKGAEPPFDLLVSAAGHTFAVDVLSTVSLGTLDTHAVQAGAAVRGRRRKALPVLAVPFMSDAGREVCAKANVQWFDFSGNAHIVAPGLRILVAGRQNRYRGPGRPASVFAPKSARVVRWLLMNQGRALTQREIARATEMTEGFVSRIVSRLESENYIVREANAAVRVKASQLLLDAWREEYRFDKHLILQGHVAARSGDALARYVGDALLDASIDHAATGLAAAWQMTRFAAFRIATFFLTEPPSPELSAKLGFREDVRGANLWLVIPNDEGVFQGSEVRGGLRCVHPVQTYVDLKAHPERAPEAAEQLRSKFLGWRNDG